MVLLSRREALRAAGGLALGGTVTAAGGAGRAGGAAAGSAPAGSPRPLAKAAGVRIPSLDLQWVRGLPVEERFEPRAVARVEGGFVVAGDARVDGEKHASVLRTDDTGVVRAHAVPDLERRHVVRDVATTSTGRAVLATKSPTESGSFLGLVGVDADGSVAWTRLTGSQVSVSTPTALLETGTDAFVLVGSTLGLGVHVRRVSAAGAVEADVTIPFDTRTFYLLDASLAADGDVYLVGAWQSGTSPVPVDVARVGQDGTLRWRERFTTDFDVVTGAVAAAVAGSGGGGGGDGALAAYNEVNSGTWDTRFLRVDADGVERWRSDVMGSAETRSIVARADGFVAGGVTGENAGATLAGLDDGQEGVRWRRVTDRAGTGGARDLWVAPDGRVVGLCDADRSRAGKGTRGTLAAWGEGNLAPEPSVTIDPERPEPGEPVTLSAADSTDPDGWVVAYRWDVGADGQVDATGETVEVTLEESTTVRLTVEDAGGVVSATVVDVQVATPTPTPTGTPTPTPSPTPPPATTTTSVPGFGTLGALGALGSLAALAARRVRPTGEAEAGD